MSTDTQTLTDLKDLRAAEADDVFMSALDLALDRPHTSELVAFDALTPHVREVDLAR